MADLRFHRTFLDKHLRVKGRTTWYESVSEMQEDLDAYIETYKPQPSLRRPRPGGADAVSGLQEGDPQTQDPEEVNQEGGEDRSLKR